MKIAVTLRAGIVLKDLLRGEQRDVVAAIEAGKDNISHKRIVLRPAFVAPGASPKGRRGRSAGRQLKPCYISFDDQFVQRGPVHQRRGGGARQILANKGILTAEDLLYYIPYRYEDRTRVIGPGEVRAGEMATVIAEVSAPECCRCAAGRSRSSWLVKGGGRLLNAKWFNAAYLQRVIRPGQFLALHGKVEFDPYASGLQMMQPQYEILPGPPEELPGGDDCLEIGRIVPIYETAGNGRLTSRFFRRVIHFVLESLSGVEDPLPPDVAGKSA